MIETLNYIIVSLKNSTVTLYNNDEETIKCMYIYLDFDTNTHHIEIIVMTAVSERSYTPFCFFSFIIFKIFMFVLILSK